MELFYIDVQSILLSLVFDDAKLADRIQKSTWRAAHIFTHSSPACSSPPTDSRFFFPLQSLFDASHNQLTLFTDKQFGRPMENARLLVAVIYLFFAGRGWRRLTSSQLQLKLKPLCLCSQAVSTEGTRAQLLRTWTDSGWDQGRTLDPAGESKPPAAGFSSVSLRPSLARNSKALGKPSADSWWPTPSCWTSTASSCWIRAGMLPGRQTGSSASATWTSNYLHAHTQPYTTINQSGNWSVN